MTNGSRHGREPERDWDAEWRALAADLTPDGDPVADQGPDDGAPAPPRDEAGRTAALGDAVGPPAPEPSLDRDLLLGPRDGAPERAPGARPLYRIGDTPRIGAGQGPRDYSPPEIEDEDRWVPDEPPPATGDRLTRLAWAGIAGGPLLLLLAVVAFHRAPPWYVAACIAVFVGGCVLGFLRLPQRHRDPDDDGAEV